MEIAPPFYRTEADRPSATPAIAGDRALSTLTVWHAFGSLLHRIKDLMEIEHNGPTYLGRWNFMTPIRPIHRLGTDSEFFRKFLRRQQRHRILGTALTLPARVGSWKYPVWPYWGLW